MSTACVVVLRDQLGRTIVSVSCQANARRVTSLTAVCFNVDHIPWEHFLLLQAVIDCRVQLELFSALHRLQADDDVCDDFTIPSCLHSTLGLVVMFCVYCMQNHEADNRQQLFCLLEVDLQLQKDETR